MTCSSKITLLCFSSINTRETLDTKEKLWQLSLDAWAAYFAMQSFTK